MSTRLSGTLGELLGKWGIHPTEAHRNVEIAIRNALKNQLTETEIDRVNVSIRWNQVTLSAPPSALPILQWQRDQLAAIAAQASGGTIETMKLHQAAA